MRISNLCVRCLASQRTESQCSFYPSYRSVHLQQPVFSCVLNSRSNNCKMAAAPYRIAVASGDGIGPEVCEQAIKVLQSVGQKYGHAFEFTEALVGGAAWEKYGKHLPQETLDTCASSDAILFGSVGGPVDAQSLPKWANAERNAILGMRNHFNLAINIRPSKVYSSLSHLSPLKTEVIGNGIDIVIIRELLGGAYFGAHETSADGRFARDDMTYTWAQIESALRFGFVT